MTKITKEELQKKALEALSSKGVPVAIGTGVASLFLGAGVLGAGLVGGLGYYLANYKGKK